MTLNKHNYHTEENTYISNSKAKLYRQSKEQYKKVYIDKSEENKKTKPLLLGSMVDCAFENGTTKAILENWEPAFERTCYAKDNRQQYDLETEIIEAQKDNDRVVSAQIFDLSIKLSTIILESDLYKWYKEPGMRRYFQKVVKDDRLNVCGMLDVLTVDDTNKVCYIDDLKTSASRDCVSKKKWMYKCREYGYFDQMAIYKELVSKLYPGYEIVCRHIVIDTDKYHHIHLYIFDESVLAGRWESFIQTVAEIQNEKEWIDKIPTWDDAEIITYE